MYETKTDTSALAWSPTGWPGVSMKMLQQVESSGGMTGGMIGMMRMEAGSSIPAHSHTHADQAVFVIEGDLVETYEDSINGRQVNKHLPSMNVVMRATTTIALLATVVFCSGCSTTPAVAQHWNQLKPGLTKQAVTNLIGTPRSIHAPIEVEPQPHDSWLKIAFEDAIIKSIFDAWYERWEFGDFGMFDSLIQPADTAFIVYFDSGGRVVKLRRPVAGPYALNEGGGARRR
jgi:hypothetical protein